MHLRWIDRSPLALVGALLLACTPGKADLGGETEQTSSDTSDQTTSSEPGATSSTGEEPASTTSTSEEPASTTSSQVQHAACDVPFPDPAPALPAINLGPDARPRFDDWRDLDCESLTVTACGQPGDPACSGMCLEGVDGGPGVCSGADIDIWCDGEGEAVGYGDGACWVCSMPDVRALACCEFPDGFDCRAWPYPSDGPPGSICARHEDCEPGLVCGAHKGSGYGICQCPGLASEAVVPPQSCFGQ